MRTLAALFAVASISCGGAGPTLGRLEAPIVNGTPDDSDASVVGLAHSGALFCSGTLIAPRVVLTAAHCVLSPDFQVFFGASFTPAGPFWDPVDIRIHPLFQIVTHDDDLALVRLDRPAPAWAQPRSISETPLDDSFVGGPVRLVGFGRTATDSQSDSKRQGMARIGAIAATSFTLAPDPALGCNGDSGGAAFITIDGTEELAGITSTGDAACTGHNVDTRVDAFAAKFIAPYLAASTTPIGQRCFLDDNCASGLCEAPPLTPDHAYCSSRCRADGDCPAGWACAAGVCELPSPEPGAFGARCDDNADCQGHDCAHLAAGAPRICTRLCSPGEASSCPSGYRCLANPDSTSSACLPAPLVIAGCSVAPSSPANGAVGLLGLLALLLLSRICRRRTRLLW